MSSEACHCCVGVPVPAPRAYWKGYLKLSFVACPIALYPATSAAERLSFRQVNRRTGHRLRHKLVDSVTGEAVDSSNKARGYEVGEDEFLLVGIATLSGRAVAACRLAPWNLPSRFRTRVRRQCPRGCLSRTRKKMTTIMRRQIRLLPVR